MCVCVCYVVYAPARSQVSELIIMCLIYVYTCNVNVCFLILDRTRKVKL